MDLLVCNVNSERCMFDQYSQCPVPEALFDVLINEIDEKWKRFILNNGLIQSRPNSIDKAK